MIIENIEVDINITDNSSELFAKELLQNLQKIYDEMNVHAMSEYQMVLQGKKEMLGNIILYIEKVC